MFFLSPVKRPGYDLYGNWMNHGIDIHREHSRSGLGESCGESQQNQETR